MALTRGDIEAVASRVVELLQGAGARQGDSPAQLVDAATVARLLGVSRATVYANAEELGAFRVGTGKRARLRFDPTRIPAKEPHAALRSTVQTAARQRSAKTSKRADHLLPIRSGTAGAKSQRLSAQSGS